ncbi:MAG: ankyrin repeat domain-containing protein, partial [Tepidisphaeraceae bacterium]
MLFSPKSSKDVALSRAALPCAVASAVEPLEQRVMFYGATVGVNTADTHQTMDGFGAAMATWKSVTGYSDAAFYDRVVNDLGATIARTSIWPTFEEGNDNADPNTFNWDGYDEGAIGYAMTFMKRLQDRGMKNLLATVWTPPTFLRTNQTYYYGGTVRPDMRDEFAEYLAAVAISAKRDFGVDLSHVSVQNEPFFAQEFESATYTAEQMREVVRATMRKFAKEGLGTKLVVPEEMAKGDRYQWYIDALMNDPETAQFAGAFGVHSATNPHWKDVGDAVAPYDQHLWSTESHGHDQTIQGALLMAQDIWNAVTQADASAYVYWQWSESAKDGKHALMVDGQPAIKYHVAKHFYRYVRPGAVRIGATSSDDRLRTVSFKHPETGAVTHVLFNPEGSSADVTLNLSGSGLPGSYKAYRTSGSENHVQLANVAGGNQVKITLPANSIVTLYSGPDLAPVQASSGGALPGRQKLHDPVLDKRLNKAAVRGDLGDLREWLSQGDDVNATMSGGYSALHAAAAGPYATAVGAINELLAAGANVAQATNDGFTPLHFAAMNVWTRGETTAGPLAGDKIRALTAGGSDANAKDDAGRTPLHWAAMMAKLGDDDTPFYEPDVIDALLDGGASVNAKDAAGFTPLDYAGREGNTAAASELKKRGGVHGAGVPADDTTAPTASVVDVSPDPRATSVDSIDVKFSEAVSGVGLADFELTRDGIDVMPAGASIAKVNATTWRLSGLAAATGVAGTYVLKLERDGSGIKDAAGNALVRDASDVWVFGVGTPPGDRQTINGTTGNDTILITGTGLDIAITVNGVAQTIDAGADELLIDGLAGDDAIIVDAAVTKRILITGSGGNDTIQGG